jgi:tRNA-2-methylthio-N6-dimethylallyladenosine synthase
MKYYIFVVGCDMNKADAERLATVFRILGLEKTEDESEANVIVAISCSVRLSATNRIFGYGKKWQKHRKNGTKIIVTGCVLEKDKKKLSNYYDHILPIEEMVTMLPRLLQSSPQDIKNLPKSSDYLSLTPKYNSSFRAYVPIMTGCDNFCSYCAVPYVRGREKSRPAADVVKEVRYLIGKGYKEITLLGQNVNSYGVNNKGQKTNNRFVELIKKIDKIPGDYRVYFYSNHPKDFSDELIELLPRLNHFPPYIHLPLQSGDDEILKKMNRHYTKDSYLDLIKRIKKNVPEVAITTDIIVGYPGETRSQFLKTKNVVEEVGYEMAFVAQYSPRPGTLSAKLEDNVSKDTKKKREKKLMKVVEGQLTEKNKKLIGKKIRVLLDGKKGSTYYGRTEIYKVVEINLKLKADNQELVIGEFYNVKIAKAGPWKMVATLS